MRIFHNLLRYLFWWSFEEDDRNYTMKRLIVFTLKFIVHTAGIV